ncbi:DUF4012 domain-containing protein [Cellulosimicrobium terreum]|uniref:DUF4012 domain-containing protein n=1 Tax=Cellulosimicrobium funkei TaxID=264251 RepID=A0A4Y8R6T2_9MICO|nr:DUF4012 domain-containing protein [Cellulosimicrobium funkei]TGA78381.1 DUF4012 domain-containing protein [Cellulosimicrobium terreum]
MVHDGWGPGWSGAATVVASDEAPVAERGRPARRASTGRRPSRRTRRRVAAVVALVVVLGLVWLAWLVADVLRARAALEDVAARLPGLQEQVRAGEDAGRSVDEVRRSAAVAAAATHGPPWVVARALPFVGDDARALGDVTSAVDRVAQDALPRLADAVAIASPAVVAPSGGAVDLAPLVEARDGVVAADRAVAASFASVASIDTSTLVGPLASAVDDLRDELGDVASQTATAARAVELVPPMLGADGTRDYLVLVQNNAEPRATGGIAGSVLHLRAESGGVELVDVRAGSDLGTDQSVVELSGAEAALFGDDLGRYMLNVTSTPDYPRAARVAREAWARHTGEDVDGVLAVDPVALAGVLGAVGPVAVTTPGGEELRLTGDDAAGYLLNGVYRDYDDPAEQDQVLGLVARQVFAALTAGTADPAGVVETLAQSAREGRLLVWSARSPEQERLSGTVLSGELLGRRPAAGGEPISPVVGVYLNATTASKTGYYLDSSVALDDVTCRPDGSQAFTLRVTLTSTLSADAAAELPEYVLGAGGDGTIRTNLLVYAPAGGGIRGSSGADGDPGLFAQVHDGLVVGGRTVALAPGGSATYAYEVVSGRNQRGDVSVRKTPGARHETTAVSATGCP